MTTTTTTIRHKLVKSLKSFLKFTFSKRSIPTIKGTLAYLLVFVFSFLHGFDSLSDYPLALSGTPPSLPSQLNANPPPSPAPVIVVIAVAPGKPVGACVQNTVLAMLGVLVGALDFFILAELGHVPVAQGVVFVIMVYLLALIKAQSITYLPFALLALLMTFNGIFTSQSNLSNGLAPFSAPQLISYLKAYSFGAAIVLFVNLFVWPTSSENQLRQMLVRSLDHVRTFVHLVNKGYLLELTDEERAVRSQLVQSIRADFGFLSQVIDQTSIEIVYSRWSMSDYRLLVLKMRSLQATLIAAYSGLLNGEENDSVRTFKERFLPAGEKEFRRMRRDLCATLGEVMRVLATEKLELRGEEDRFKEPKEVEAALEQVSTVEQGEMDQEAVLEEVGRRLQREAADEASDSGRTALSGTTFPGSAGMEESGVGTPSPGAVTPRGPTLVDRQLFGGGEKGQSDDPELQEYRTHAVKSLRNDFDAFAAKQLDVVGALLVSGGFTQAGGEELKVFLPMTSMADAWGKDHARGVQEAMEKEGVRTSFGIRPIRARGLKSLDGKGEMGAAVTGREGGAKSLKEEAEEEEEDDPEAISTGQALVRVYSMLFAMNRLITELQALHTHVTTTSKGVQRHYHLHVHIWESLRADRKKGQEDMCLQDALSQLEQREYIPKNVTLIQRMIAVEQWFRSPNSIYAFKVVLALCVFAVLLWAPVVRGWFISYALTSALPTIVIALSPTLGQSYLQFTFQILGTAIGNIAGMILLLIFNHVGGYVYNPYGLACLVAVYAIPFIYVIHEKPQLFVLGLLSLNSAGVLIITEYVQADYVGNANFDSAPYRAGKGLAALSIAITLVLCFQLLILRNPARHTLRKALAHLIEEHLAYVTMLQAYCRALGPIDANDRPSHKNVLRVESELKRREAKLQARIIGMNPLISFAAAEPQWEAPFRSDAAVRIVRANQILLDRWSEARSAIGTEPFPAFISREFISVLSPYRRQAYVHAKVSLYLAAASMASKMPLPLEVPKAGKLISEMMHDALLLSSRFAKTDEGRETVKSGEFARYWFFLLVMTSACRQVSSIEEGCRLMYGSFEDKVL
ncbi:hypothetical protein DACRYDRAFT_116214 [Dacryopinax primogenitus]|uniref:Uncharacterized protein n=1 Tax=Dacryopinax primogenitus (strain DJM 731) TaxID=1858805 RepID=M5G0U3_DACPD|nr:uncharacterized protein DACRYDRAFT_116214 [Dacryopinax primogenitus]EJU01750.1 hypothetical protein DACRYDRAFT_116214 [Dacryopinax primogenitus]